MKQAKIKSIFLFLMMMLLCVISTYALTITLNHPVGEWVTTSSVDHNFTPSAELTILPYCAVYSNSSGTMSLKANYTNVINGTPHVAGIGYADSSGLTYLWFVNCSNGTNVVNSSLKTGTFGVDANLPTILLTYPDSGEYINTDAANITFIPTDASNPEDCDLYSSLSGAWAINTTFPEYASATTLSMNLSGIANGVYIWNVVCNQTSTDKVWAQASNRTFTVDTVVPTNIKFVSPTNNTYSSNSTPYIVWNLTTETNFEKYQVRVSNSSIMDYVIQIVEITNRTMNYTTLSNLGEDKTYYIQVEAFDLAGNSVNSTSILYYQLDSVSMSITLNAPSNGSYSNDNTPDFNVTVIDRNPAQCRLLLSNASAQSVVVNKTTGVGGVTNGTLFNITPTAMRDGTYKFNIECNDSNSIRTNVSTTLLDLTIDTVAPTSPNINSNWHLTNSSDKTPTLSWTSVTETNFAKYVVEAYYLNTTSVTLAYQVNVSTRTSGSVAMNLLAGYSYTFNVTAYDLAGNTNVSINTTSQTLFYVDSICGTLVAGWNLCGAVWTTSKNLSVIGSEMNAYFVSVWNTSNHAWATCNYVASASGTNCEQIVGIAGTNISHVWIYVNSTTEWRNRTWSATRLSANVTLTNNTNGWNLIGGFFRNGITFGNLGRDFGVVNVTMFSMPYNNGTSASYVNKGAFANSTKYNGTVLNYGRAMWIYYNASGTTMFNVGSW